MPFAASQLGKASPALAAFKAAFAGAKLERGSVVSLSSSKGGKLRVVVNGKQTPVIAAPELCTALWDIYLGSDPVVPEAKQAFGAALAAKLAGGM